MSKIVEDLIHMDKTECVIGLLEDESSDNAYCEMLYQNYLSAPEEDKELVSLEEAIKILRVKE